MSIENWPPSHFAVLQNGDGSPPYLRPIENDESVEQFADRIGSIVARDIEYPIGTTFVDAIEGSDGTSDIEVRELITQAMESHKTLRHTQRETLRL
jgi:hypothetical protein